MVYPQLLDLQPRRSRTAPGVEASAAGVGATLAPAVARRCTASSFLSACEGSSREQRLMLNSSVELGSSGLTAAGVAW